MGVNAFVQNEVCSGSTRGVTTKDGVRVDERAVGVNGWAKKRGPRQGPVGTSER